MQNHRPSHFLTFVLPFILAAGLLLPPANLAHAHDGDSVVDEVLDRGSLRVGLSSFVPWAMRSKNGDLIGFEVDVANKIAQDMEVELELVPTAWDGIIPALLAKKFDIIISGMFITPKRNLQVNFTIPYDYSGLGMVANKSLASGYDSLEDFNRSDVVFALRRGAYPVEYVRTNLPNAQVVEFDDDASARQELINGNAHAWVASEPEPHFSALDYPDELFLPLDKTLTEHRSGMALRKGDADSLNFFDNWIRENKDWVAQRRRYWFESREWLPLITE